MGDDVVKLYWRGPEERAEDLGGAPVPGLGDTHPLNASDLYANRRDFLKAAGFTLAGAALSSCARAPVQNAIPFLIQPEGLIPGRAYYQTSTCTSCSAGCGVLVKTQDGRPIKLEGNPRQKQLAADGERLWRTYVAESVFTVRNPDWDASYRVALRLTANAVAPVPPPTILLHAALALGAGATHLLSFDPRSRQAASTLGLRVLPVNL